MNTDLPALPLSPPVSAPSVLGTPPLSPHRHTPGTTQTRLSTGRPWLFPATSTLGALPCSWPSPLWEATYLIFLRPSASLPTFREHSEFCLLHEASLDYTSLYHHPTSNGP